jgi:uncharacterized damage-inducible protein DinB
MIYDNNPLLKSQVELWQGPIRRVIDEALELAPDDKLDWMPAADMIPLGKLFLHISETSDWWYDEVMKGKSAVELALPEGPCPPKSAIKNHIETHWQRLQRFFSESPDILARIYTKKFPDGEFRNNGYWIFAHLLEHDIHHRSQINQYLRILGIVPPK